MSRDQNKYTSYRYNINIREIINIFNKYRNIIFITTIAITTSAGIFSFNKAPVFQATALIEIGGYYAGSNFIPVESISNTVRRVQHIFINGDEQKLSAIKIDDENYLSLKSLAKSKEMAISEISQVLSYISEDHKNKIKKHKNINLKEIEFIDFKIANIENVYIKSIKHNIEVIQSDIDDYNRVLKKTTLSPNNKDQLLVILKSMERRELLSHITRLNIDIHELQNMVKRAKVIDIGDLELEKQKIELEIFSRNYKTSKTIGDIIANNNPVSPRIALTVFLSFILGFMLSLLSAFFFHSIKVAR